MRYLVFLSLIVAGVVHAAPPSPERGQRLYAPCITCHGEFGVAIHPDAPHLAHQPALALTYQLIQFRDGRRRGGGMELNAAPLSDQDMKDISAYLSQLPPPPMEDVADRALAQGGADILNALYCNSCHGRALEGQKHIPALARQKSTYLFRQLQHFKSGERIDLDGSMENAVQGLDEQAMHRLSTYAASH